MLPSNAPDWEATTPPPKKGGPRLGGGLVLALGLLVALAAVIAFAITQMPTGTVSRPAVTAPNPRLATPSVAGAAAGAPADAATQQAIQDVIRKVDDEQSQAIATKDQTVMAPTATPEFFAQQVANNQDLVDNGVTEVKLLNMEWGQITVNGNSATATVYETWSTTFDDGTTEQARDRNVYTLVQNSAGSWIVQADDHPDQAGAAPTN
jgi:ketosteroid isomerase-like protein